ncbi:DUF4268 domain-containing protein [Pedobacter metabolipauper]|uniref:Uncharacterized protein DUF4268 n=1 Tax=Pedobacter metabolipauper TaxID=425513 RepID=A0A4V3D0K4_9SPHI|nr:DUF4268 domain-containing protein [Pedobacter metabolipauper]TDQ06320.1 uncharacterized protein DUF4268 [Pedobacter metabolipauper]
MYSKDQASSIKQSFWTAFGQYMALQPSAEGQRINWVNYKTGIKHLNFKMDAGQKSAAIAIEIVHPDPSIQELIFEQFKEFKNILNGYFEEEWEWELHVSNEYGKTVTRIVKHLYGVNIFKQEDWPDLITFFKVRMVALDQFWDDAQYSFDVFK